MRRGATHALRRREPEFDHPSSIIYFRVGDINAARAELADRGVSFDDEPHLIAEMPDHELWMTFFRDPDRNMHALMSEVPLDAR